MMKKYTARFCSFKHTLRLSKMPVFEYSAHFDHFTVITESKDFTLYDRTKNLSYRQW